MAFKIPTFDEAVEDREIFPYILSAALDFLGYSYDAIKERQRHYELIPLNIINIPYYIVGSKGEGLTRICENDNDLICLASGVECVDDISDVVMSDDELHVEPFVVLAERNGVSPGYTKLKVLVPGDVFCFFRDACFESRSGDVYLSNIKADVSPNYRAYAENGPAQTSVLEFTSVFPGIQFSTDCVLAIPYKCQKLIKEWKERRRYCGWPSEEQLQEVSQLDWHVVPVGSTKEGDGFQEWRICFTLGEMYLIKTFNHAQLHLVILLKLVSTITLKPVCAAISSYIMKNIVLWMAELLPWTVFKIENVPRLLMVSLATLRRAVDRVSLKNYMIPARNMFKGKISRDEREILMAHLDSFLLDGPSFILKDERFPKLSQAMFQVFNYPVESERRQHTNDMGEARLYSLVRMGCQSMHHELEAYILERDGVVPFVLEKLSKFHSQY